MEEGALFMVEDQLEPSTDTILVGGSLMKSTLTKSQSDSPSYVQRGKQYIKTGQTPPLSPKSPVNDRQSQNTLVLGLPLWHMGAHFFTFLLSNHKETSDKPKLGDILPKNWPALFQQVNVTKFKGSGCVSDTRRPKCCDNSMHCVILDRIPDKWQHPHVNFGWDISIVSKLDSLILINVLWLFKRVFPRF